MLNESGEKHSSSLFSMPDVANTVIPAHGSGLSRVGMTDIEVPVILETSHSELTTMAKVTAQVSLDDPDAKGIHMSRLFLIVQNLLQAEPLSYGSIRRILDQFIASHEGISRSAFVSVAFELPEKRPSLLSDNAGWRAYPCLLRGRMVNGQAHLQQQVKVTYSSTCPCSAALARQLIQKDFAKKFAGQTSVDLEAAIAWLGTEEGVAATPHGQRSCATVDVVPGKGLGKPQFLDLIDLVEQAVSTPVQTVVKRQDEQEFARLNGRNLMFAEDAVRRVSACLENREHLYSDYRVKVEHFESLHPHNAVAVATKGVANGFSGMDPES